MSGCLVVDLLWPRRKIFKFPAMGDSKSYSIRIIGSSILANGHNKSMKFGVYKCEMMESVKVCASKQYYVFVHLCITTTLSTHYFNKKQCWVNAIVDCKQLIKHSGLRRNGQI